MRAVAHAQTVLSWQENLSSEEIPPEWMWAIDDELEDWFDEVTETRKARWGVSDDGPRGKDRPSMMANTLAESRRRR